MCVKNILILRSPGTFAFLRALYLTSTKLPLLCPAQSTLQVGRATSERCVQHTAGLIFGIQNSMGDNTNIFSRVYVCLRFSQESTKNSVSFPQWEKLSQILERTFVKLPPQFLSVFLQDGLLRVQNGHVHLQVRSTRLLSLQNVVELLHLEKKAVCLWVKQLSWVWVSTSL